MGGCWACPVHGHPVPSHDCALFAGSGRLPLTTFFPQGLLEERNNQVFFGEVGRQMVTGLMTKAEKVAVVGLFQMSLQNLISDWVFALFCFVDC